MRQTSSPQPAHFKCLKTYNPPCMEFHKTKAAIPRIYNLIPKKIVTWDRCNFDSRIPCLRLVMESEPSIFSSPDGK